MSRRKSFIAVLPVLPGLLSRFWPYLRPQRALIASSSLALIGVTLLRLLEPWPLKLVFDYVLSSEPIENATAERVIGALDPLTLLTLAALAVVAITGLRALAEFTSRVGFALLGNRVLAQIREEVFRHLQGLSLKFHASARGGDLVVRVINDVNLLRDATVTAILPLLANVLILVGMWSVMFWLHWQLALVGSAILPLLAWRTARLTGRIREAARAQRTRQGAMAATAAESIGAIRVVQALSLEDNFARDFARRSHQSQKEDVKSSKLTALLERSVDIFLAIATALVLWFGARLVLEGQLTPGDLLVFLNYLKRAFNPLQEFAKYTGRLAKATAAGERVLELLDIEPQVQDLPHATAAPPLEGAVCFDQVSFAYEPGCPVLRNVSFQVQPGEQVALVGASGIGKSTLLSLLMRLYDPIEGRVLVDGRDIRDYTLASLRPQMSVVLQDNLLFAASVYENIAWAAPDASPEAIEAAARAANAHAFIEALPEGYQTVLGERGVTLSHGQRQRLAIARAAVRQAPLLILDEPTTSLDEENQRAVVEALSRLAHRRTTFLITHNLLWAAQADRVLFLEGGDIAETGSHAELMRLDGRYAALYRMQAERSGTRANHQEEAGYALRA